MIATNYRDIEELNLYAEILSIMAYLIFIRIFAFGKRWFSGVTPRQEIELATTDPLWQQLIENEEDFLAKEPSVMCITRLLFQSICF